MGQQFMLWLGAGVVTAGVSGAMFAGAGVAAADTESASDSGGPSSSESAQSNGSKADSPSSGLGAKQRRGAQSDSGSNSGGASSESAEPSESKGNSGTSRSVKKQRPVSRPGSRSNDDAADESTATTKDTAGEMAPDHPSSPSGENTTEPSADLPVPPPADDEAGAVDRTATARSDIRARVADAIGVVDSAAPQTPAEPVKAQLEPETVVASSTISPATATQTTPAPSGAVVKAAAVPQLPSVINLIGSAVFNLFGAAERLVAGPPVLPPGSTVTVRSSTLEIGDGQVVPADWYYPATDEPPTRLIYLQHGFLATGPMYSYTAAYLAESTNSIVVTPSLTSNPFAADAVWLGGDGMQRAVADLFVGDREALTRSAVEAGYAKKYGLDPAEAALPQQFALVGHSLGGGLVSGVAGYTVDNGAAANLVGVILLDGVPTGDVLPNALAKLDAYEQSDGGRYIPVRVIGAPTNFFNSSSNANQALSEARPDRYNGVVLVDGAHMDAMQGGNPVIQLAAYLVAGFPQKESPPAVQDLAGSWINDWFEGRTDVGDDLVPGSTLDITTEKGTARATVIGEPPATSSSSARVDFEPVAASAVVSPRTTSLAGYWLDLVA